MTIGRVVAVVTCVVVAVLGEVFALSQWETAVHIHSDGPLHLARLPQR